MIYLDLNEEVFYWYIVDGSVDFMWHNLEWRSIPGNEGLDEPAIIVADYIRHLQPYAKLVAILRNPVDR